MDRPHKLNVKQKKPAQKYTYYVLMHVFKQYTVIVKVRAMVTSEQRESDWERTPECCMFENLILGCG